MAGKLFNLLYLSDLILDIGLVKIQNFTLGSSILYIKTTGSFHGSHQRSARLDALAKWEYLF